jgi:hypothetical protein
MRLTPTLPSLSLRFRPDQLRGNRMRATPSHGSAHRPSHRFFFALTAVAVVLLVLAASPREARAAETLDQVQEVTTATFYPFGIGDRSTYFGTYTEAQRFTAGLTGNLTRVDLSVGKYYGSLPFSVQIEAVNGSGLPNGEVLSSGSYSGDIRTDPGYDWVTVPLTPSAPVSVGTTYTIVLTSSSGMFYLHGGPSGSGGLPGITTYVSSLGYWSVNSFVGAFRTYVDVPVISVDIDVKPGTYPNDINLSARGVVPVAILSSATFVTLAGASVALTGSGTPQASFQDVNGDGLWDLVVQVRTQELQLTAGDTEAVLEGATFAGNQIHGVDTIRVVP